MSVGSLFILQHLFLVLFVWIRQNMATRMSLKEPRAFLHEPGQPVVPWRQWISAFDNYLEAMGGSDFAAARKKAILLHCLGLEGQRVYDTLPARTAPPEGATEYDNARFVLGAHFIPRVNVVAVRHKFRQRSQQPGESVDTYIAALRDLCRHCKFDAMDNPVDEMIRDQLVEKTSSPKVREKLLMEQNLTLDNAIAIANSVEEACKDAKALGGRSMDNPVVNQVTTAKSTYKKRPSGSVKPSPSPNPDSRTRGSTETQRHCFRCGSRSHMANSTTCPAKDKRCNACHRIGHFSKLCRNPGNPLGVHQITSHDDPEDTYNAHSSDSEDTYVLATNSKTEKHRPVYCTVKVNHVPHRMLVDTGTGYTLISRNFYNQHFVSDALEAPNPDLDLSSYTNNKIDVIGRFHASVMFKSRVAMCDLHVVNNKTSLLGRDLMNALRLSVGSEGNSLTCNSVSDATVEAKADDVKPSVVLPEYLQEFNSMFTTKEGEELQCVKKVLSQSQSE